MNTETETEAEAPLEDDEPVFGIKLTEIDSILDLLAERQTPLSAKHAILLQRVKANRRIPPQIVRMLVAKPNGKPEGQPPGDDKPAPTVGKRGRGKGRRPKHPAG